MIPFYLFLTSIFSILFKYPLTRRICTVPLLYCALAVFTYHEVMWNVIIVKYFAFVFERFLATCFTELLIFYCKMY